MEPVSREQIVAIIRQRADRLREYDRLQVRLRELQRIRDNRAGRNIEAAVNGRRGQVNLLEPRERGDRDIADFGRAIQAAGEFGRAIRAPPVPPPVALVGGVRNRDQPQVPGPRQIDPLGGLPVVFLGDRNERRMDHPNQRIQEIEREHADRVGRLNALGVALEDAQRLRRAQGGPFRPEHGPLFRQATIPSDEDDCGSQIARTTINVSLEGDVVSYASSPDQPSSVGLFICGKCLKYVYVQ